MNLAAFLWKLPVILVCENNGYATTASIRQSGANPDIAQRGAASGTPEVAVDDNDVLGVCDGPLQAVRRARQAGGPTPIEARTYWMEPSCGIIADGRLPGERERSR
jgi:TPP-dependent pyruvate/acetoin dehydrogenase alpha subunit